VLLSAGAPRPSRPTPRRHVVEIQGMTFNPTVLKVARGDTVVWVNGDMVPHTASGSGKPAWSTGTLAQDESGQYVPRDSGIAAYFCELHPVMSGKLIIQ
jgi:plastocyanin